MVLALFSGVCWCKALLGILVADAVSCDIEQVEQRGASELTIVRGIAVSNSDFPHTVFLEVGGGYCSGTLVSPRVVLTAKHCFTNTSNPANVTVKVNSGQGDSTYKVVKMGHHPVTDITLLALNEATPYPGVPVDQTPYQDLVGTPVTIVGFGTTAENAGDGEVKRMGKNTVRELDDNDLWGAYFGYGANASGPDAQHCYGDSGGSTYMTDIINGKEVRTIGGVISGGDDICESGKSWDVSLYPYRQFIETFVEANDPDGLPTPAAPTDPANGSGGSNSHGEGREFASSGCSIDLEQNLWVFLIVLVALHRLRRRLI